MKRRFTKLIAALALLLALWIPLTGWGQTYTLVSSLSNLSEGTYCIAALYNGKYYTVPKTTVSGQTFNCTEATYENNVLTPANGHGVFVLTAVSGIENAFYIYNTNLEKYLVATGSKKFGYVDNTSNDYGYWTFSTVQSGGFSGQFSVQHSSKTQYMRAYQNSVRCYDGTTNQGVYLFIQSATPTCSVNPTSYDFGEVQAGSSAQTKQFTVTTANLTADLSVDFMYGTYYSVDVDEILSTETSKTLTVTLNPTDVGSMDDYLIISGTDLDDDIAVLLTATGTCTAPTTPLAFETPINLTFDGAVVEYTLNPSANTGNGGTITYEVTTNPDGWGEVDGNVFTAYEIGTYVVTATQVLDGTICGGTFDITINVVGTDPTCTITPDEWDFGTVAIGESDQKTFTVTTANLTGDVTLAIENDAFTVEPTTILQNATSTEITITFTPTTATTEIDYLTANGGGINNDELAYIGGTGVPVFTVSFNAGTGTCDTEPMSGISGTEITLPTAEPSVACAAEGWTFAGWATDPVNETTDTPELLPVSYTITSNITLYAVYKEGQAAFDNTSSGSWPIYAIVGNSTYYATGSVSNNALSSTTNSSEATVYTFEKGESDGQFAIKLGNDYICGASGGNVFAQTEAYYWTITEGTKGSWRVTSTTSSRALLFRAGTTTLFKNYATSNVTANSEYYDLEIGGTASITYNSNPSCLETVATPTFSPAAGSYTTAQSVEISCETEDATIYYTTDGTVPTTESTEYEGAIEVNETKTIKAIAVKEGMNNSAVATATYTIDFEDVATPTFDPASGATFYTEGLSVTISCATEDASIYYTLDGSAPTSESTLYEGAISLTETTTIKAIAMKEGMDNSAVATATYTYFDPNGPGTMNNPYTVSEALSLIGGWSVGQSSSNEVYVSGIVSKVSTSLNNNRFTYHISDNGETSAQLQVYKGLGLNGETFTNVSQATALGEQVIVKGYLSKYSNTVYQFNADSKIVLWLYESNDDMVCQKVIPGYGNNAGGYHLVASFVDVDPADNEDLEPMLGGAYDLYYFDESENKEWRNYKAATFDLEPGKGYLYANSEDVVLTISGTSSVNSASLKKTPGAEFSGMNLVGNPLASKAYIEGPFYIMNNDGSELVVATRNYIFPMEGVFVSASEDAETLNFSADAPDKGNTDLVVNVNAGNKTLDRAIVSFGEGGMLPKFQLNQNSAKLFISQGTKEFAVVNSANEGEMPVNFKAAQNGTYTFSVEPKNVKMTYLHLIDNMTGADVDLLQTPSYSFEVKTSDYASRFRLVFSANNTDEDGASTGSATFAYYNGSNWTVSNMGEATLQVVDVMGRVLSSETLSGNAEVSINQPAGVYMLRLVSGDSVKVQKVVVR